MCAHGVAMLEYGVAMLEYDVAMLEYGVAMLEYDVAMLEYGVAMLEYGVAMLEYGVAMLEYGVAMCDWCCNTVRTLCVTMCAHLILHICSYTRCTTSNTSVFNTSLSLLSLFLSPSPPLRHFPSSSCLSLCSLPRLTSPSPPLPLPSS